MTRVLKSVDRALLATCPIPYQRATPAFPSTAKDLYMSKISDVDYKRNLKRFGFGYSKSVVHRPDLYNSDGTLKLIESSQIGRASENDVDLLTVHPERLIKELAIICAEHQHSSITKSSQISLELINKRISSSADILDQKRIFELVGIFNKMHPRCLIYVQEAIGAVAYEVNDLCSSVKDPRVLTNCMAFLAMGSVPHDRFIRRIVLSGVYNLRKKNRTSPSIHQWSGIVKPLEGSLARLLPRTQAAIGRFRTLVNVMLSR